MQTLERLIGTLIPVQNTTALFPLKLRPNLLRTLRLFLTVTINCTVQGAKLEDAIRNFISGIRIQTQGAKLLKSIIPALQFSLNRVEEGIASYETDFPNPITVASHTAYLELLIPFKMPDNIARLPLQSVLNTAVYDDTLNLYIDFAPAAAISTAATFTITAQQLDIYAVETPMSMMRADMIFDENIETYQRTAISAANNALEIDLAEDTEIKTLLIRSVNNSLRSDALINSVVIKADNGNRIYRRWNWRPLQARNQQHYRIAPETGIAIIEFDPDGDLKDLFDTNLQNVPKLELSVNAPTGTAFVDVHTRQIVRPVR